MSICFSQGLFSIAFVGFDEETLRWADIILKEYSKLVINSESKQPVGANMWEPEKKTQKVKGMEILYIVRFRLSLGTSARTEQGHYRNAFTLPAIKRTGSYLLELHLKTKNTIGYLQFKAETDSPCWEGHPHKNVWAVAEVSLRLCNKNSSCSRKISPAVGWRLRPEWSDRFTYLRLHTPGAHLHCTAQHLLCYQWRLVERALHIKLLRK
jgi:hypothetical protein